MNRPASVDQRVAAELWTSFASQIRSYAAAHGLNSRHHAVVEVGPELILLRVNTRWLEFTHDTMTEDGGSVQVFQINEDGTVTIGNETAEMDMTAERLTREMLQSERISA